MSDLVKRLRTVVVSDSRASIICAEAADRIEELEEENKYLTELKDELFKESFKFFAAMDKIKL